MTDRVHPTVVVFCALIAIGAAVAAAAGLSAATEAAFERAVSVRGERYFMTRSGIYAYNAQPTLVANAGRDWVTLFLAAPIMLLSLPGLARGSLRGRLAAVGVTAYIFYRYLGYAVSLAFGWAFPVFVLLSGLSAGAFALLVTDLDVGSLGRHFSGRFPRRSLALFAGVFAAALLIGQADAPVRALATDIDGILAGRTTFALHGLDLALLLPLAAATSVTVAYDLGIGYLLSAVLLVNVLGTTAGIAVARVLGWTGAGFVELLGLGMLILIAGVAAWLITRVYLSVNPDPPAEPHIPIVPPI